MIRLWSIGALEETANPAHALDTVKKWLVAAVTVLLILIGLACRLFWPHKNAQSLAPLVALPDGTSVRIVAVTYGTNHVIGTKAARMAARLPSMLQDVVSEVPGVRIVPAQSVTTPTPELLVWLDQRTNRPPASPGTVSMTAFLGDGSNFISGADAGLAGYTGMSLIYPLHFSEFPRRDRKITLNIFSHDAKGVVQFCNSLSFANPLYQTYPQWQAESLPVTNAPGTWKSPCKALKPGTTTAQGSWLAKTATARWNTAPIESMATTVRSWM